jgi:RNA polymerase sigma factor, sigma-70 family
MSSYQNSYRDIQLWKTMLKGNETAFSQIYQLYSGPLQAYGSKIFFDESIVQDAIQDIFIHLWNKRSTLPIVNNVRVYLLKCLRNRLFRILEKQGKIQHEIEDNLIGIPSQEDSIILKELKKEQLLKLHFHLQNLPIRQREVIHLKFFQNLNTKEIATLLSINYQSVSNTIHRGLNTLKTKFQASNLTFENKRTS